MSRLDNVIKQVKEARNGKNKPWIFDDKGNIKDDVLICDVLPLLESLKEYEIEISNSEIEKYLESEYYSAENTYNWNANISNDLDWKIYKKDNSNIAIIMVHLYGDIRCGYSDYFVISMGEYDSLIELFSYEDFDSTIGYKELNENYIADYEMFSECIIVFDKDGNEVGEFYETEKEELLKEVIEIDKLLKSLMKKEK